MVLTGTYAGRGGYRSLLQDVLTAGFLLFLLGNILVRLSILLHTGFLLQVLVLAGLFACCFVLVRPQYLGTALFLFACSFPLYGSHSYQVYNIVFELFVAFFALVALILARREEQGGMWPAARWLLCLLGCYLALSVLSLVLLPLSSLVVTLSLWGWQDFFTYLLQAPPGSPLFSLAAVNRLLLYGLFVVLLSSRSDGQRLYHAIFAGLVCGAVLAAAVGVLNYYHLVPLEWFREAEAGGRRLQSFFGNPGWFAEFLSVSIPFILIGFLSPRSGTVTRLLLFAVLVICEMAILLTASRTGWLIYPLVLASCWLIFYLSKKIEAGRLRWRDVGRVAGKVLVSVPLTILISYFLVTGILHLKGVDAGSMIQQRFAKIADPATRKKIWQESMAIGLEAPVFGMGYETYRYQVAILGTIDDSLYAKARRIHRLEFDTPHNLYIQLFISNGIVGVLLWMALVLYAVLLLLYDLKRHRRYFNIAVFLSIAAFHQYGLAQSMQYIGVIWLLVFLNIGYAMTLDEAVLPVPLKKSVRVAAVLLAISVCAGGLVYGSNFESYLLAEKYGLRIYAADQQQDRYHGFYPKEEWKGQGTYRWTGARAQFAVEQAGVVQLHFFCSTPGLGNDPVVLDVFASDTPLDRITFWSNREVARTYYLPASAQGQAGQIELRVSRTWNPRQQGVSSDTRNLGVAVREPEYRGALPETDLGLYGWQMAQEQGSGPEKRALFRYRWTRWQAVLDLQRWPTGTAALQMKSEQPWLEKHPVEVRFIQEHAVVATARLTSPAWNSIALPPGIDRDRPLILLVNRPWNPEREGYGADPRDLGVAVRFVQSAGTGTGRAGKM